MKRSPRPLRKKSVISDSLNHHLNMYAVAAGAAGVGMLALAQPAEARIVYTPANTQISFFQSGVFLDVNNDGVNDFFFILGASTTTGGCAYSDFFVIPWAASNAIWRAGTCAQCASALPARVRIGGANRSRFSGLADQMANVRVYPGSGRNVYLYPWANGGKGVTDRYLGLSFSIGGQIHYGWARLNVTVSTVQHQKIVATLTGYAYETVPNKPIRTGVTADPFVNGDEAPDASLSTPDTPPVSLGVLALGAPGLEIWRREEKAPPKGAK